MKFQFYYEKLLHSEEYQTFFKENPKAFPCSALFIIDKEKNQNKVHFDYFLPEQEKIVSFNLDEGVELIPVENIDKTVPEKLGMNYTFDLADYEKKILEEIKKQEVKGTLQKLLFSLQTKNKKPYLITTGFMSNLSLLKISINLETKKIESFEKRSFFDLIKVVKGNKKKD